MIVSLILAAGNNNVIGKDNKLIWHLPADLKYFKNKTSGHHIIMGRKTYQSVGRPLPNRTNIIITRDPAFKADGCLVVNSLSDALALAKNDSEVFIVGGAEIYKQSLNMATKIYLTRIHADFEGDTFFPVINATDWKEVSREDHLPDEKNKYAYSFIELIKR